jgi:hypothetical protein
MGRETYHSGMEQRLHDLSFRIECVRSRLLDNPTDRLKVELAWRLAMLEERRDSLREKLAVLSGEPDGTWEELKAEVENEWDALAQDFEERVSSLS